MTLYLGGGEGVSEGSFSVGLDPFEGFGMVLASVFCWFRDWEEDWSRDPFFFWRRCLRGVLCCVESPSKHRQGFYCAWG